MQGLFMSEASKKCRRKRKQDMNWMKRHLIYINMVWASILLLGSCTSESGTGTPDVTPVVPNKSTNNTETAVSQDEITFQVKGSWEDGAVTRVTTIDSETDLQGYDIRIDAYYHGYETAYLSNTRLRYSAPNWLFHNGTNWTQYYWPIDGSTTSGGSVTVDGLDFVGYLPYNLSNTYVTLGAYSKTDGPSFSCVLPVSGVDPDYTFDESNQNNLQEFMIAYTTNRKKDTANVLPMPSGVVPLAFVHPLALVYFYLEEAPRGTKINTISFDHIYTQGTNVYSSGWGSHAKESTLSITVNKTVPNELNFNGLIGGPYVVIPENLSGETTRNHTLSISIKGEGSARTTTIATNWQPGMIYNYKLNLGSDPDRILVNLEIEEWKTQSYKTPVEVN